MNEERLLNTVLPVMQDCIDDLQTVSVYNGDCFETEIEVLKRAVSQIITKQAELIEEARNYTYLESYYKGIADETELVSSIINNE